MKTFLRYTKKKNRIRKNRSIAMEQKRINLLKTQTNNKI
jgi:hypothetical protein